MKPKDLTQEQMRPEDMTLEECIQELAAINEALSSGRLGVEMALSRFERGVRLHERASEILARARLRVSQVLEGTGTVATQSAMVPAAAAVPADPDDDLPF